MRARLLSSRFRFHAAALAALVAWAPVTAGCTNKLTPPAPDAPVPMMAVTPDSVQSIFDAHCAFAGCHGDAAAPFGERLDAGLSYQAIVNVPSGQQPSLLRIKPLDAAASYLIRKLDGGPSITGMQMPRGAPALPDSVRDVIRNWTNEGALADSVPVSPGFLTTR